MTTEWNDRRKHWDLPKIRGSTHQIVTQRPFSPPSFPARRKRWGRRRHVRNDHGGTSPRCSRSLFSSVLISSFPNRKLNLRFEFYSKFATTSQSASLTAPLGGEPFCGGMEPRGILRRLRRLRADWISFLILRKAQNCGVDTPRNPVGRTRGFLAPLSAAMQKRHPKWDGVFAWWS